MALPSIKHGEILRDLQILVRKLPGEFQQKLSQKILVELAHILDETVFDIVKNLTDIQQMTERSLFEGRMNLVNSHRASKDKVLQRHRVALDSEYMLNPQNAECLRLKQAMEIKELDQHHEEELTHLDMKVIMELDQAVSDQQITLQKAGIPGFFLSNKPDDVRLQMYLLEFITTLSSKEGRS